MYSDRTPEHGTLIEDKVVSNEHIDQGVIFAESAAVTDGMSPWEWQLIGLLRKTLLWMYSKQRVRIGRPFTLGPHDNYKGP